MVDDDDAPMKLDDRALPAARHLVGPGAIDVLRLPIEASGGSITSARPVHVQYRPGSDVVVRYSAWVSWNGAAPRRETLAACSAINGIPPGTVAVTAATTSGPLDVGVWRWPFDPVLTGLDRVVTPNGVADALRPTHGPLDPHGLRLDVVAYRPTERTVIRVDDSDGAIAFLKIVSPSSVASIVDRHAALLTAGVPVPCVDRADGDAGLLVLEPLRGPTYRELIKSDADGWPCADEFDRLAEAFAATRLDAEPLASRLSDGALHAHMLAGVMPDAAEPLARLARRFETAEEEPVTATIHGDLHDGQIIVRDARIVGVLDIDDAGPGRPIDDRANLIARLLYREHTTGSTNPRLSEHIETLRRASGATYDPVLLDVRTAAALVGLATGPFRLQSPGWRDTIRTLVAVAESLCMRELSAGAHRPLTETCAR
jgi:hypothetical protein